jgi:hypothetical protein
VRFFYDCEFIEEGVVIDLLSIRGRRLTAFLHEVVNLLTPTSPE